MNAANFDTVSASISPTEALLAGANANAGIIHSNSELPSQHSRQASQREGFRVGTLNLMVHYEDASELADMPVICRLPHSPPWFLGMTNLHGALVPVFDLADRWGTKHDTATAAMLLVLGHGDERAGIVIDGLPTRLRPTLQDRLDQAAEPAVLEGCIVAVHRIEGRDWIDLTCSALLGRLQRDLAQ